jgi:plastocyanin
VRAARLALVALAASLLLVPSSIGAGSPEVNIEFSDYRPSQLDVLPGETVVWTNVSERTHTVTSDTGVFDSGDVIGGAHFSFRFDAPGVYRYHCTIHPSITGEVDVRRVTLDTLPPAAVPVGKQVEFSGRTADPAKPVTVQRLAGSAWQTVASATPAANGDWKVSIAAQTTGDFRATSGTDVSETRRLLVSMWKIAVRRAAKGLVVRVTPSAPYAPFLLEVYLRERFGWWPVARGTLDYISEARVRLKGPARVRVVLVDRDGWTPLGASPVVRLP